MKLSNIFDRYYSRYDAWYEKNRFAYLSECEALKKVMPERGKGLEIGVGTGRFASFLGIGFGVDPSRNMINIARQRGIDARLGVGEKLPFKKRTFDYAAIIITLCFAKNPKKVLKEAKRVLKKRGKLILGVIDKDSFLGKFYRRKKSIFYKKANFFSVEKLEDLLETAGFKPNARWQTVFKLPAKMNFIENPQKGFGKGGFVVVSATKT